MEDSALDDAFFLNQNAVCDLFKREHGIVRAVCPTSQLKRLMRRHRQSFYKRKENAPGQIGSGGHVFRTQSR